MVNGVHSIPCLDKKAVRRLAHCAGVVVAMLSLIFVVLNIRENWSGLVSLDMRQVSVGWLLLSGVCYALAVLVTSLAWPAILKALDMPLPRRTAVAIGLTAQIGKYIPGNVMHYLGRATLAARHSITLVQSGSTTMVELASAPIAAGIYIIICILMDASAKEILVREAAPFDLGLILFAVAFAVAALWILTKKFDMGRFGSLRLWAGPVAALTISFVMTGLSFYFIALAFNAGGTLTWGSAGVVFALAWLAGFLVPGSPAGLGVREALIVAFLATSLGAPLAIVCALAHRILAALLDVVMALTGGLLMAGVGNKREKRA